jgi:hypothetical protein
MKLNLARFVILNAVKDLYKRFLAPRNDKTFYTKELNNKRLKETSPLAYSNFLLEVIDYQPRQAGAQTDINLI